MWSLVVVRAPVHQGALYTCRETLSAKQEHGHRSPLDDYSNFEGKKQRLKMWTHPKDSLFTSQWIPSPSPEENVGLPTGHNSVWVSGVELHSQDHLISGLKQHQSEPVNTHHQLLYYYYYYWTSFILCNLSIKIDIIIKFIWKYGGKQRKWIKLDHLNLSNLWLLLPIPHCQHVVITVINYTQVVTGVLKEGQTKTEPRWIAEFLPKI